MNPRIAIFYHCVFSIGGKRLPAAETVVTSQMKALQDSGLLDAASNFFIGVNGEYGTSPVTFPEKANVFYNGSKCRTELRTLRILERWLPGHEDWLVFYFHSKGVTHKIGDTHSDPWRECMEYHLLKNWTKCVQWLQWGYTSVGCHWMEPPETPETQYIWAGNFWWSRASYLLTLPSLLKRERVKRCGLDSVDSRYEGEVWHGNGETKPFVKDFCPNWNPGRPHVKIGATVNA